MFIAYKNLINGDLANVDNNKLFILNRWASFNPDNAAACSRIDRLMLKCDKNLIKSLMGVLINKRIPKYFKAEKADAFLVEAYKKHYEFSQREYEMQKHLIKVELATLALEQGWDKKICKKYKIA